MGLQPGRLGSVTDEGSLVWLAETKKEDRCPEPNGN